MTMLVYAGDDGTTLVLPGIDPANAGRVRAERYVNGKRIEDLVVAVEDWPAHEASLLDDSFFESEEFPELRVEVDRVTRQMFVAGGNPIDLPDGNPDSDNPPTLVDFADQWLADNFYFRMTDWWADDFGPLRATICSEIRHGYDFEQRTVAWTELREAGAALRRTIRRSDAGTTEAGIRAQLVLYRDPTENGFLRKLGTVRQGQTFGPQIDDGLNRLVEALAALRRLDGDRARDIAAEIRRDFPCPMPGVELIEWGPEPIEWSEPRERGGPGRPDDAG
jgi:hypothetical protein